MTNPTPTPTTKPAAPASTRDRLLDAAAELFYREGVGVGVEALCRTAGVSKRSMYQLFDSKDEVMAASLERSALAYYQVFLQCSADDERSPRARILHVFERLEESAAAPDFRGCPFVATAVEVKSPEHPASLVARRSKDAMTAFFQQEAERGGAEDPALLARQLTVVFDGSSAWAVVQAQGLDGLAVATAGTLLDGAGIHP
ncbi:TetR/AcrR family transcriptional regulator [Nonomuraea sp. NEAU-A123]|uniref:TetR/AcrR family transcriptional regulator n=1 Tax=Nonomuraea sp. NEAU-A123 TaxID=2839649 RepID=UPI001BE46876|nr:TetR/AcrR family transcriptional regulator [Nonomuraea sp. NEAU-A123]MBT2225423.1 TetR/AcrR family transcriptional regulator [Nonomuraea sp. NEAU-A123]